MNTMYTVNTMACIETDFTTGLAIVQQFTEMDEVSMLATLGVLVDTVSAKSGKRPAEIIEILGAAVSAVNDECGEYNPYS